MFPVRASIAGEVEKRRVQVELNLIFPIIHPINAPIIVKVPIKRKKLIFSNKSEFVTESPSTDTGNLTSFHFIAPAIGLPCLPAGPFQFDSLFN